MSRIVAGVARATRNFIVAVSIGALVVAGNVAFADPPSPSPESISAVSAPATPADATPLAPADGLQAQPARDLVVPANTEVVLATVDEISSKTAKVGDKVKLVTLLDVMVDGATVIPKGALGEGVVTYQKGKGSFGKSGKLELAFTSLDVNGKPVALTGKFQQQGEGNTGGTVAAVVAAGLIGGALVTGHSAVIHPGQELRASTAEATTLAAIWADMASAPMPPAEPAVAATPEAPKE